MLRSFYRNLSPALLLILVALVVCIVIPILTLPYLQGPAVVVTAIPDTGRLTVTRPVTFTSDTGKQDINLGKTEQPGRYILQLANDTPPFSNHWLEWDSLALKASDSFIWQIGQDETPPHSDEFCSTSPDTDCRTGFKVVEGKIDERKFPKTLNDGEFPVVRIAFTVPQEQTGADLILTLSTLYSSHSSDIKDFKMQVTLQGPF